MVSNIIFWNSVLCTDETFAAISDCCPMSFGGPFYTQKNVLLKQEESVWNVANACVVTMRLDVIGFDPNERRRNQTG